MFEQEIKEYYDMMTPSDETKTALMTKIYRVRKKRARYKLAVECFVSVAACFVLAVIINFVKISKDTTAPDNLVGTVLSVPNGYLIAAMLLVVLITAFVIIYRKKVTGYSGRQYIDKHK